MFTACVNLFFLCSDAFWYYNVDETTETEKFLTNSLIVLMFAVLQNTYLNVSQIYNLIIQFQMQDSRYIAVFIYSSVFLPIITVVEGRISRVSKHMGNGG